MNNELVIDYEVNQQEYEEERRILADLAAVEIIGKEIAEQKNKQQPKWARLARKYLPSLRDIYYNGELRDDAQWLISELVENSTTPLNDLDMPYDEIDGEYQQVDSYTGEKISDYSKHEYEWDLDYLDTQALIGLDDPASELFGKVLDDLRPEYHVVVPSLQARLYEEYSKRGCSEEEIKGALDANKYEVYTDEPDDFYENDYDPLPSVPLSQEPDDMKVDPSELIEFRSLIEPELQALFDLRSAFFENEKIKYKRLAIWKGILNNSREKTSFLERLQYLINDGWETQYAAIVFLSFEGDWGLDALVDAGTVHVPILGTLDIFIEVYADEILENLYSGIGNHGSTTEATIDSIAEKYVDEIIEKQFVDSRSGVNPVHTKEYARGVFDAVASGRSNLTKSGWNSYYAGINKRANQLRNLVSKKLLEEGVSWNEATKAAKDVFWNAAQIVKIRKDKLLVSNLITGKSRWIAYEQAIELVKQHKLISRNKVKLIAGLERLQPTKCQELIESL